MLTANVRFEGWTTEDWRRLLALFKPRAPLERESSRPRGGIIAIRDGGRVRKLLHTGKGRIEPPPFVAGETAPSLEALCEMHSGSWALGLEHHGLEELMERFGARCRASDDFLDQSLKLVAVVRELMEAGIIERWPERLKGVPVPSATMVHRTLDTLCRDGHVMCLGMFKDEDLYTSLVLRRKGTLFDLVAGPDNLRAQVGLLSGDFRRDQRYLVRAVEETYGPLSLGCFAEFDFFRELAVDPRPGAWSRAVTVRDVILSPLPTAIAAALGFDGARVVAENARALISRFDSFGLFEPAFGLLKERVGAAVGSYEVESLLGFNPLVVLRALLKR
ncbi:MAG: hypothetical protein IPG50_22110 [Myxococcales bacterium]|nr:hypothetical protein [Myxococcales bacterium]